MDFFSPSFHRVKIKHFRKRQNHSNEGFFERMLSLVFRHTGIAAGVVAAIATATMVVEEEEEGSAAVGGRS